MLSIELSFLVFSSIAVIVAVIRGRKNGWSHALGVSMAISLLSASWFEIFVTDDFPIKTSTAVAVVMLSIITILRPKILLSPIGLIDIVLGCLVIWNIVVDVSYGTNILPTSIKAWGEWMLPFAAGRYAMIHRAAMPKLAPWFVTVMVVMGVAAIIESLTSVNLWGVLFHEVDDSVTQSTGKRYNLLYRAIANVRNPIFLGVLLITLLPWIMALIESNEGDRKVKFIGLGAFLITILGVFATVSRGPVIALIIVAAVYAAISNRIARLTVVAAMVIGGIGIYVQFDNVVRLVDVGVNERGSLMEIDGEVKIYDGTRHRLMVLNLYVPIIAKAGPMGFGSAATGSFPPQIPGLPSDPKIRDRLGVVDNSFLVNGLRLGYVGLTLLASLFAATVFTAISMRQSAGTFLHPLGSKTMTLFASTFVAIPCALMTLYWDYDFAFWVLMHMGLVAGMASQSKWARRGINIDETF